MGWNYLSIPKLQWCNRWSLGINKYFISHFAGACDYLSMLGLKLNHVSKRGPRWHDIPWWCHRMETFSTLLDIYVGNSLVTGEFPPQRPVTRSFDVFFDLRLNKQLSKQSWGWWFEMPSHLLWRHCNAKWSMGSSAIFTALGEWRSYCSDLMLALGVSNPLNK